MKLCSYCLLPMSDDRDRHCGNFVCADHDLRTQLRSTYLSVTVQYCQMRWLATQLPRRVHLRTPRWCSECSVRLSLGKRSLCGADARVRQRRNDRMREYLRVKSAEARSRGESYTGRWMTPEKQAARLESLAAWRSTPEGRVRHRELRGACAARRRAKKLGSEAEVFLHREIYERDGWICGLCGASVDRDRQYPDPASSSLDHIIPLSFDDGHHTRENVQLAHLSCNLAKGARVA